MNKEPVFKVGDKVRYELDLMINYPRWDYNEDKGGSGIWAESTITRITEDFFIEIKCRSGWWNWPLKGHKYYAPDQWSRPGYLQLIEEENKTTTQCECGAHKTSNPNLHSNWCPRFRS